MTELADFMANIRKELGFPSSTKRSAKQCPPLFETKDTVEILDRIDSRSEEKKRELLNQFEESAGLIHLHVHKAEGFAEAGKTIAEIIGNSEPEFDSARQIIQHDHPDIAALELADRLEDGMTLCTTSAAETDIRQKTISSFVGITVPRWGVADSATVLQETRTGQPRSTSLVPAIHIGLLRLENMLADLTELYAIMRRDPPESSYVFISGPSKTADIESRLVHGAHGPKEMHVIVVGLVDDE